MSDRHNDSDKLAAERVLKIRTELIMSRRFYGVLVSNVEPVMSRRFPRAATNGKQHFWNPDFVAKLQQKHLLTVQAHESEHDARHHGTRRGDRDPERWNEACDFAINIDLVDEGFEFPPAEVLGGEPLIDPKYRGMSAEDIYRSRELDEQAKQQPQPQPEQGDDEGDDGQDDESEPGENADTNPGEGDQDSDDGDQDGETGQDDGEDQGDGQGDDGEKAEGDQDGGQGGQGKPMGEPEADGQGDGQGSPQDGTEGQGKGQGQGQDGEGDQDGEPTTTVGDTPGSLGEVLDSAEDAGELSDDDRRWEKIVRQAVTIARGDTPGHITREIEKANNPTQNWREVLRQFIDGGSKRIETWNRPNRRFAGSGLILPGSQRDGLNRVVACIDTSGSMDDVALKCVQAEMIEAFDAGAIDELHVVYGDVRVTRVDEYHAGDEITFDPKGGGGTDLKPMFEYVRENIDDPSLMIVFTDLEIGDAGPAPECPALFAVTGHPDRVRDLIANATPWGAVGIDVGAH